LASAAPPAASGLAALAAWLREGARTALLMHPRWPGLHTSPGLMALLFALNLAAAIGIARLYIDGPAHFYWRALASGWLTLALLPWCAWLVRGKEERVLNATAPDTPHLFTLLQAQSLILELIIGALYVAMIRGRLDTSALGPVGSLVFWLAPQVLSLAPMLLLLWRGGTRKRLPAAIAMLVQIACLAITMAARPADFWYAERHDEEPRQLALTQETMEAQPRMLSEQLNALQPQRPGKVDMYALTFAPYYEDVFRRESAMVAQVMTQRFDTKGRTLQLVNHPDTARQIPWATPINLQRAIARIAQVMDRDEDILFIHMTSHGAANGHLATQFAPLSVPWLTPQQLKQWLDEAGIRHRVISVSACYSGSWIAPLANDDTLVMTAADADHTSYGCGSKSDLTFFGRAMYDEQLRTNTLSFEQAHAAARKIILQREQEAGKTDGYSNPQISAGPAIHAQLARMQKGQL
jgi:hypothetical protein